MRLDGGRASNARSSKIQRHVTGEELDAHYLLVMGPEIGETFNDLRQAVIWLMVIWNEYKTIFEEKSRVDLVNEAAGGFFGILQGLLQRDTMMSLRRLTDPAQLNLRGRTFENMTLKRLAELLPPGSLQDDVNKQVDEVASSAEFARKWSNKLIAHNDVATLRNRRQELPRATVAHIDDAIEKIWAVLQTVEGGLTGEEPLPRLEMQYPSTAAEALLYVIRDGLEARQERRQRILDGKPLAGDIGPGREV